MFVIFPSFALKIVLGSYQKISKGAFSRTLFVSFRCVFFRLAMFPPLHSKLTLEIVKRRFFSNPFRFVFVFFSLFVSFFPVFFVSFFMFVCFFSVSFFHFIFHCDFCACLFSFSFLFSFFVWVKYMVAFLFFILLSFLS